MVARPLLLDAAGRRLPGSSAVRMQQPRVDAPASGTVWHVHAQGEDCLSERTRQRGHESLRCLLASVYVGDQRARVACKRSLAHSLELPPDQELLVDLPVMEAYAYKYAANPAAGARRIMLCAYSLARSSAVCAARSSAIVRSSYPTVGVAVLEPQGRTLDDLAVLRWLEHGCFLVSESSPLLVLYWQVLFSFLFRRLPPTNWPVYRVACDIFPTYAHPTCSCFLRCLVDAKKWKRHLTLLMRPQLAGTNHWPLA